MTVGSWEKPDIFLLEKGKREGRLHLLQIPSEHQTAMILILLLKAFDLTIAIPQCFLYSKARVKIIVISLKLIHFIQLA